MNDLPKPDYTGQGLLNLMSSLIEARGWVSAHPPLAGLDLEDLKRVTNLILLVIDGLGDAWLARHAPDGILSRARIGAISSVFPPTTTSAIATVLTGCSPLEHGLTGWFTYFAELGAVLAVLPGRPRYGGVSYRRAGIDPQRLLGLPSLFDRIQTRGIALAPGWIADSDFNRALIGCGEVYGFDSLEEMFNRTLRLIRPRRRWGRWRISQERRYLYLYWPRLDAIGHEQGIESAAAQVHLAEIEQALEGFLSAAKDTDTVLVVTADHGQIDVEPQAVIDLADHPALAECLVLPLCGEPRAAWAYVRAGAQQRLESYCRDRLDGIIEPAPSHELIAEGYLGPGPAHPRIWERVGDYCLLPREGYIIRHTLPLEERLVQIGVHGGLSTAELWVPLCAFWL
ncbi:alkaline phosphatase family protein [Caldichromatium japonicum]|uniref:Alkaline phosphatase family protein n=1 Tax=Caldichromatium japonicum TaxID=2699430 RepID=A0A6G7VC46_9GAMM|nr:alkaline phosphatase family protein [Caldichromatium japonicum]QIK37480.1 alkaline phosphatase family protein [Caldichromatium japonicum]